MSGTPAPGANNAVWRVHLMLCSNSGPGKSTHAFFPPKWNMKCQDIEMTLQINNS